MKKYQGIRPRGEGSWEINFRPHRGAKSIFVNVQAASRQEASLKRSQLIVEALKTPQINADDRESQPFDVIWPSLERNIKGDGLAHKTFLGLRCVYNRLFTEFRQEKFPQVLTPRHLTLPFFLEYKSWYGVEKKREGGLRAEIQRVKVIMNKLRRLRYCSEEVLKELSELKTPEGGKKIYPEITQTQLKAFFAKIKADRPDIYGPAYFMLRTGRRVEETTLIERRDIEWDGFNPVKIKIRAETTKMRRDAPLNYLDQDLQSHIRLYYQKSNNHKSPYLFLNGQNQKFNQKRITLYLGATSQEMFKDSPGKVKVTAHYFRHHFCTETCKARLPLVDILAVSGIKNVEILINKYCHGSQEGQASVLERTRL